MRTLLVALAATFSASAMAYESEPADVWFSDTYELLNVAQFDTGWLPSQVPFGLRFYIQPTGGIVTDIPATSHVRWPQVLEHGFEGYSGIGSFGIDTELEMAAQVNIDISIYQDTFDLWADTFSLTKLTTFDGLLLPGSQQESVEVSINDKTLIPPVELSLAIITGVELAFELEIYPEFTATMSGRQIDTAHDGGIASITSFNETAALELPQSDPGMLSINSIYHGFMDGSFDLVLKPTASLNTIVGDFDILTFEWPVSLLAISDSRVFEPVEMDHPLPFIETNVASHNFGEVVVGESASVEITFTNSGELDAVGEAFVDGSDAFSLNGTVLDIKSGRSKVLTVTYTPVEDGDETAMLVLESNDPSRPELTIPLGGGAVELDDPTNFDQVGDPGEKSTVQSCGCAAQTFVPATGFAWLPLLGFFGLRRRQS